MTADNLARANAARDLGSEANALQFKATVPENTVWVGASAGSGKTKVLAERVLRLLLPDGARASSDPGKILCITFTKAAASEVLERIMKYLRSWAIAPEDTLSEKLRALLGATPTPAQMAAARSMFARALEVPGGMKIMTIHAFCQSVLARFPMEAGLPAGFEVMEENESRALMTSVRHDMIADLEAPGPEDEKLRAAFDYLAATKNADDLEHLMTALTGERARLRALRDNHGGMEALCAALYALLDTNPGEKPDSLVKTCLAGVPAVDLRAALPMLRDDKAKTNQAHFDTLDRFLAAPQETWPSLFDDYRRVFLTADGAARKAVGIVKDDPRLTSVFAAESDRLQKLDTALRNLETATATESLLRFAFAALDRYENGKRARNRLDYEDLIDCTRRLLSHGGVHWVQYKLDGGIDHILVDEAQDTNPDQWDIITALYDEFYDGDAAREPALRTTFVVGDEKQSIFSFQRADPDVFDAMRDRLEKRTKNSGHQYADVPMRISFRSAPSILRAVDAVFADPAMRAGVVRADGGIVAHEAFRSGKAGLVEIWPLIEPAEKEAREDWSLPDLNESANDPVALMADRLADRIARLLDGEILESQGRPVRPGDIMILLNRRRPMADAILKALRRREIPVGGIDRMVVGKQLAVMDVLAVLAFVLQPDDDLILATLLKSPLAGLDEDALYTLCRNRETTLWAALKNAPDHKPVADWLGGLLEASGRPSVSSFLHRVLYGACPADPHGGLRAMMARLGPDIRDPLQELLARADAYDAAERRGLQGFLQDAQNDDSEIRRQMEEGGNRVRLMTVHGSKGLEAPIVFMPDTVRATASGNRTESVLWPARSDAAGIPLWAPNAQSRAPLYDRRVQAARARADEEYRRLLYVALTRAGDRLYIGGAQKSAARYTDRDKSWYFRCLEAFTPDRIGPVEDMEDGTKRIANRQTDPVATMTAATGAQTAPAPLPAWARSPAPAPESPPRPLMPSRPSGEDEPAAASPLLGDTSWRFRRGRIIHTLFQFLPDLPREERSKRAKDWLAQPAHALDDAAQTEILESVFAVLNDPSFAPIFTGNARAEVPLTGLLGPHTIVSGQIDRLLVGDNEILAIDYKTNRPAPPTPEGVPQAYRDQMRTYRDVLGRIWPGRTVRCALLWTDGPDLMDITDKL